MRKLPAYCLAILQTALLVWASAASYAEEAVPAAQPGSIGAYTPDDVARLPPADQDSAATPSLMPDMPGPGQPPSKTPPFLTQDGIFPGFGMGQQSQGPFRYSAIWFPSRPVEGQNANWGLVGQDLSFMHSLWTDQADALMFTAGVSNRLIETDAIMPDSGQPYPSELWNAHVGLMYRRQFDNGWIAGGGVSFGSASDHPFASIHEMEIGMNAMLRIPQGEHNAWVFTLMYSPMSEIAFPIPGVAFSWNPSDEFHMNVGLPFQVTYKPTKQWLYTAMYMPIHTIHVKAKYLFGERLGAFVAYDWSSEVYELADRVVDNERFFMYDERATVGLEASLAKFATATVMGGYAFNRYSYQATSWNSTELDRVNVDPGPFVAAQLIIRY